MHEYPPARETAGQPSVWPREAPDVWYPQARVSPSRRSATPLILGVVTAIAVLAVVAVVALRSLGTPSLGGTWYGAGTTGSTGADAETFKLETYLSLTQDGATLSGSGELCSVGTSNIAFRVSGTTHASTLDMTWTLADGAGGSPGSATSSTERVSGHFTNSGTLSP